MIEKALWLLLRLAIYLMIIPFISYVIGLLYLIALFNPGNNSQLPVIFTAFHGVMTIGWYLWVYEQWDNLKERFGG